MADEPKQKRVGAYAKLLANYASDDALIEAGERAELLFVRGLAFCATSDADGYITDSQVTRIVGAGMNDALKRADRLAEVGVWERAAGGFVVRSWLKIHESAEQKGRRLRADRERKKAGIQTESTRNPDGGTPDSLSMTEQYTTEQYTTAKSVVGERPETLQAVPDTTPPNKRSRCAKHPNGNPTNENCRGCKADREHDEREAERERAAAEHLAEKAVRARRAEADACPKCHGSNWVELEAGKPLMKCREPHTQLALIVGLGGV